MKRFTATLIAQGALLVVSSFLLLAGDSLAQRAAAPGAATGAAPRPNVVLILADDLGWGDVGYNGGRARTPHIDRLSARGMRFNRFYAQPICTPTRTALMTGRYPWRSGMASGVVRNWGDYAVPLDEVTLGEVMQEAGYYSAIVGKWHLGHASPAHLPTERGFDYHYGLYTQIDHFTHEFRLGGLDWHRNGRPVREGGYATDLLGEDAARIIRKHDFSEQPLFLYHPAYAVHGFKQAPERYTRRYEEVEGETQKERRNRRNHLGLVEALDVQVGRIVDALKERGQLENTLLLFASDNGGNLRLQASNDPLRGGKGTYYEGGVRVPAFAYWKGEIAPTRTASSLVYVADFFPTVAHVAGAELPDDRKIDGLDLGPLLFESEPSGRSEIPLMIEDSERRSRGALIQWPWKLRRHREQPGGSWAVQLFNLETDPTEDRNVAESHPEIVSTMSERLNALRETAPPPLYKRAYYNRPPEGWEPPPVVGPNE